MGRTQWHPVRHHEIFRSGCGKAQRTLPNARRRCGRSSSANQPRTGDQSRPGRRRNMERKCDLRSLSFCVSRFLLFKPPQKIRERLLQKSGTRSAQPLGGHAEHTGCRAHRFGGSCFDGTLFRRSQKMARCFGARRRWRAVWRTSMVVAAAASKAQAASSFLLRFALRPPFCSIATAGTSQDF